MTAMAVGSIQEWVDATYGEGLLREAIGDIDTLTIREYQSRTPVRRLAYRLYREMTGRFLPKLRQVQR
jgi:hypothetical protein